MIRPPRAGGQGGVFSPNDAGMTPTALDGAAPAPGVTEETGELPRGHRRRQRLGALERPRKGMYLASIETATLLRSLGRI
jgi:hypothetical protein